MLAKLSSAAYLDPCLDHPRISTGWLNLPSSRALGRHLSWEKEKWVCKEGMCASSWKKCALLTCLVLRHTLLWDKVNAVISIPCLAQVQAFTSNTSYGSSWLLFNHLFQLPFSSWSLIKRKTEHLMPFLSSYTTPGILHKKVGSCLDPGVMDRKGSGDHTFVLNDSRHKSCPIPCVNIQGRGLEAGRTTKNARYKTQSTQSTRPRSPAIHCLPRGLPRWQESLN